MTSLPPPLPVEPIDYFRPDVRPAQDRRGWLIAAGVGLIVLGAGAACLGITTPLSLAFARTTGAGAGSPVMPVGAMAWAVGLYALIATAAIWTGIASIRRRRWVRPVILAVAWPVVVSGSVMLGVLLVAGPGAMRAQMQAQVQAQAQAAAAAGTPAPPAPVAAPAWLATTMFATMAVGLLLFYVVLPAAYLWLYTSAATRRTLEFDDPGPSWADRRPVVVLATALWLAFGGLTMLAAAGQGVLPVYGTFLTGPAGVVAAVVVMGAYLAVAWATWSRPAVGWWLAIGLIVLTAASYAVTIGRLGAFEYARRLGLPPGQTFGWLGDTGMMLLWPALSAAAVVGFLIFTRKHFADESSYGSARGPF